MKNHKFQLIKSGGEHIDKKGQLSMEFIFLIGVLLIIVVSSSVYMIHQNELVLAMSAAREGIVEGISIDEVAVYPEKTFKEYEHIKKDLISPKSIKLVKLNYTNMGLDSNYNKEKIQFNVIVTSNENLDGRQKDSAGERINYNLRKSIAHSFNSGKQTNKLYNPVFSKHYIYTTSDVKWV